MKSSFENLLIENPAFGAGKTSLAWDDCEDVLYKMVFEHRADEKVTIEQIIEAYKVFKQDTEAYITEKK